MRIVTYALSWFSKKTAWYYLFFFSLGIGIICSIKLCVFPAFIDDDTDVIFGSLYTNTSLAHLGYIHGPLSFYLVRLSGLFFGISPLGWRIINLLFSFLNIGLFFLLGKMRNNNIDEARMCACLAFLNIYFLFYTVYVCEEIFLFTSALASILCFLHFMRGKKIRFLWYTAVSLGIGMLVKVQILLLIPGFFIYWIFTPDIRRSFSFPIICLATLCTLGISIPYLVSLFKIPLIRTAFIEQMVCVIQPSLKILYLFIPSPLLALPKVSLHYSLGYNTIGTLFGLPSLIAVLISYGLAKDHFIRLMLSIISGIALCSVIGFCGNAVEPRHLSLVLIPVILLFGIRLKALIDMSGIIKILCYIFLGSIMIQAVFFSFSFPSYARLHSKVSLAGWGKNTEYTDLNTLSKEFIRLAHQYPHDLIVVPSLSLDATGHFIAAYTGTKTLSSAFTDQYMWQYWKHAPLENILIFLLPTDKKEHFICWGKTNGYQLVKNDCATIRVATSHHTHLLPVHIVLLCQASPLDHLERNDILEAYHTFEGK